MGSYFLHCSEITICSLDLPAAQQRLMPSVVTTLKMGGTSALLWRSYNTIPAPQVARVSATEITRELLRTKGVTGLYRGLGATLMRCDGIWHLLWLESFSIFGLQSLNKVYMFFLPFQGHPILCCVLPSFCKSSQAWPALIWRPIRSFLLVLHVWLLRWMHCCCGRQSLWWWISLIIFLVIKEAYNLEPIQICIKNLKFGITNDRLTYYISLKHLNCIKFRY